MAEAFDPYLSWLGIRDPQRPPNHYTLLGVALFEGDPTVLGNAADRQMAHVRKFQSGRQAILSQQLLNELAAAKICLLNPAKKAAYDAALHDQIAGGAVLAMALPPSLAGVPQAAPATKAWAAAPQPMAVPAPGTWAAPASAESPTPLVPAPVAIDGGAPPRGFPVSTLLIGVLSVAALVLVALIIKFGMKGHEEEEPVRPIASSDDKTPAPPENGDKTTQPPPKPDPVPPPPPDPLPKPVPDPMPDPTPKPDPLPPPDPTPTPPADPTPPVDPTPPPKPEDPRRPLPGAVEVDGAIALIREVYAENYKTPISANERKLLPGELLNRARQEANDLVARFALLSEAREQAVEVGDAKVFEEAVATLGKEYRIEWSVLATAGLQRMAKKGRDVATQRSFAALARRMAGQAADEERFDDAGHMALAARDMARDVSLRTKDTKDGKRDADAVREIVVLIKDVEARGRSQAALREAEARLQADPNDRAANLVVGRHYCQRNDWPRGLPYLGRSDDAALRKMVAAEAVAPSDSPATAALADAWYDAAAEAAEANRPLLYARAAHWYRQAVDGLAGLARARVEKRLEELKGKTP